MADLASTDDVEARWRSLSDDELSIATALIGDASAIIRAQYPGIDSQIAAGLLTSDVVAGIVARMVKRAMLRADGIQSESQTVGNVSRTVQYANALDELSFTDADRLLVLGYRPAGVSVTYGC